MSRIPICGLDSWPRVDPRSTLSKGDLIIDPALVIRASIFTVRSTEYYRETKILLMLLVQSFRMVAYFHTFMLDKALVALGTVSRSNKSHWNKSKLKARPIIITKHHFILAMGLLQVSIIEDVGPPLDH